MNSISIPVPREFSFDQTLSFLQRSPRELLHWTKDGVVFKALRLKGGNRAFTIRHAEDKLIIDLVNTDTTPEQKQEIIRYITEWFDLESDLKPFYEMALKDKLLKDLVVRHHGYRIIGQPDLFESLVWAVLGQQINVAFAYTLKQRFIEQFGDCLQQNQQRYYLFPTAEKVVTLNPEQLLAIQFSKQKATYTIGIAKAFASGEISKDQLRGLSLAEAKERLMKIKGIGNWTANYALMKTFRYPDAFPLEDAGIHNAIRNLKKMKAKPTLEQVKRVFKKYKGWEAYATLYLWKSL